VHVRRNIKLAEAPSYGKTIFEYEPGCHGATDYLAVAEFIHTGKICGAFEQKKPQEPVVENAAEQTTQPSITPATQDTTESISS